MAFGSTLKEDRNQAGTDTGEQKTYVNPFMDTKSGVRVFRVMPEEEARWVEAWWEVNVGGRRVKRRLMLESRFQNPLWEYVAATFEKGSPERSAIKERFGINVYDKTPVLFDKMNNAIYPNERAIYELYNRDTSSKERVTGEASPLNQIRILEGSAGQANGKHMLQQLVNLSTEIVGPDGNPRELHEVDLRLKTTGTGIATTRSFFVGANFNPTSADVLALPRWDIASWAKGWPNEMISKLLDGEDFNELVQEYEIVQYPKLADEEEYF